MLDIVPSNRFNKDLIVKLAHILTKGVIEKKFTAAGPLPSFFVTYLQKNDSCV